MIETDRLILRPPTDADRPAIAALNADPRVGEWLSGPLTPAESDALVDRILAMIAEHGFGFWAVERKADGAVIGLAGLLAMGADLPPGPALEVGWRFVPESWGHGYATEAARAAVDWGFATQPNDEIVAITAYNNLRSQAVMERIGMVRDPAADFLHPKLSEDHPLRPHVTYRLKRGS
ncbi:GNAT family N-acetyltransferase [Phenylobacterium sp.]|uniref:GNAT family N-acetyltransferase n=1 Tax=Phenylobacterium sp. TaxID=1871053 RepID=UPI002F9413F0